ncbi:MAG TPA: fatty acid--CoA ligase family protein [Polyangiaceae bacterium]|jgi:malonyl-CoA/methylmalonyl-CoA synthetase
MYEPKATSVIRPVYEWAKREPQKTALVWSGNAVSYGRLARGIEAVRRSVGELGLPIGSTALVVTKTLLDCWTVGMALRALGLHTADVASIDAAPALGLRNVSCVVADPASWQRSVVKASPWPGARTVRLPASIYAGIPAGPTPDLPMDTPPQGGNILYTSGTTGAHKKLLLSGEDEARRSANRAAVYRLGPETVWHVAYLRPWTAVGFKMPLAVWHAGGCVVFDQRSRWAEHFVALGTTNALLVVSMVNELLDAHERLGRPKGDWQLIVTSGFLPAATARRVSSTLTDKLEICYGSTELCGPALRTIVAAMDDVHWLSPCEGYALEIVDEQGAACPTGTEGHLRVRLGELDYGSYLDDAETSRTVFRDGWFYPGDMAVRRADGKIRVLGRSADVLNVRGHKHAVAPIEHAIEEIMGGKTVCLFSGINSVGQDELVVAVESEQPIEPLALREVAHRFASFENVRVAVLREFPRTQTGTAKVDRNALRKRLFAQDTAVHGPGVPGTPT